MDGLLVVDKPAGPSSHDVVARVRRACGEPRVGHTGTLDPAASGVLALVLGRATRLARFLSAADKSYDATIRLGVATDTFDAEGTPGTAFAGPLPSRSAVDRVLDEFRGSFLQQPPAFSAKKIGGRRSYQLARAARAGPAGPEAPGRQADAGVPAPVPVTARRIEIAAFEGDRVDVHVECSAGFYVRSLAHDLGQRLGVGAHLAALRRTRSGEATLAAALPLEAIEADPARAATSLVPLARMLPAFPSATLTDEGLRRVLHGREVGHGHFAARDARDESRFVRLFDPRGELVALATPAGGDLLHPSIVLV